VAAACLPRLEGSVDVNSIVVKDENLAGHLQAPDFFDGANHPRINFVSTAVNAGAGGELEVDGELTIKGRTNPVKATGTITGPHTDIAGNDKIGVSLKAVIDRRIYGLEWNAPLPKGGFALENDVTIDVELELVREA
jgi:polyisoprenoid-binding protein YceI